MSNIIAEKDAEIKSHIEGMKQYQRRKEAELTEKDARIKELEELMDIELIDAIKKKNKEIAELKRRESIHIETAKKMGKEIAELKKKLGVFGDKRVRIDYIVEAENKGRLSAIKEIEECLTNPFCSGTSCNGFDINERRNLQKAGKQIRDKLLKKLSEMRKAV